MSKVDGGENPLLYSKDLVLFYGKKWLHYNAPGPYAFSARGGTAFCCWESEEVPLGLTIMVISAFSTLSK